MTLNEKVVFIMNSQ